MKFKSLIYIALIFFNISCDEIIDEDGATSCIREKIATIKREPVSNPPTEVYSYLYQGKTVYYFTSNCCDMFNYVYDVNCNIICAPDGGIAGTGDGKCSEFFNEATNKTLIWIDTRK
jgi:hypothetical protein